MCLIFYVNVLWSTFCLWNVTYLYLTWISTQTIFTRARIFKTGNQLTHAHYMSKQVIASAFSVRASVKLSRNLFYFCDHRNALEKNARNYKQNARNYKQIVKKFKLSKSIMVSQQQRHQCLSVTQSLSAGVATLLLCELLVIKGAIHESNCSNAGLILKHL